MRNFQQIQKCWKNSASYAASVKREISQCFQGWISTLPHNEERMEGVIIFKAELGRGVALDKADMEIGQDRSGERHDL